MSQIHHRGRDLGSKEEDCLRKFAESVVEDAVLSNGAMVSATQSSTGRKLQPVRRPRSGTIPATGILERRLRQSLDRLNPTLRVALHLNTTLSGQRPIYCFRIRHRRGSIVLKPLQNSRL